MTISKPSQLTLDNMMSLQEVSPVRTSVLQEEEKELQTNPDQVYFTNSSESYAWYDQSSLSWKTWQRSLITDWTSFSESFPKQGTMQNGQLYLQVHWEPPTDVQGGGSLPTPSQRDYKGGCGTVKEKDGKFYRQSNTTGTKYGVRLDALMEYKAKKKMPLLKTPMLPTPTASDVEGGIAKDVQYKNGNYFRVNNKGERWGVKLRDAVSILPTPTARNYKDSGENMNYKKAAEKRRLPGVVVESRSTQTGKDTNLNPHFVEEMMGYPIGWTDLKH